MRSSIAINVRQVKALWEGVKDLPDTTPLELRQLGDHQVGDPPEQTVELLIESLDQGDFLFPDGTTGY